MFFGREGILGKLVLRETVGTRVWGGGRSDYG